MERLANMYPKLEERYPLPRLYVLAAYFLFIITPLIPRMTGRVLIILPLLLILTVSYPFFKTSNINDDYGRSFPILGMPLAFLDFFVLSPLEGEDIRYVGQRRSSSEKNRGVDEDGCDTMWKKVKCSARLVSNMRGIGWNWQVKGVPQPADPNPSRSNFVLKQLMLATLSWNYKMLCRYFTGAATAVKLYTDSTIAHYICDVVIGWCGASWAYNGLNCYYRLCTAVSVAVGLCEQWEWPPLFGPLSDAWSVRQLWR